MPTNIQEFVERFENRAAVELPARPTLFYAAFSYLCGMHKYAFSPCIPTRGTKVPDRPEWLHEIKHDGYRIIVQREGKRGRLFTRNGYDWSNRFPLIVEAALRHRSSSFVLDGEAVLLAVDGRSDFDGLQARQHDEEVQFYAFDMLIADGEDIRNLPLHMRKTNLVRMLARRVDGIQTGRDRSGPVPEGLRIRA